MRVVELSLVLPLQVRSESRPLLLGAPIVRGHVEILVGIQRFWPTGQGRLSVVRHDCLVTDGKRELVKSRVETAEASP